MLKELAEATAARARMAMEVRMVSGVSECGVGGKRKEGYMERGERSDCCTTTNDRKTRAFEEFRETLDLQNTPKFERYRNRILRRIKPTKAKFHAETIDHLDAIRAGSSGHSGGINVVSADTRHRSCASIIPLLPRGACVEWWRAA